MPFLAQKLVQTTGLPLDQIRLVLSQIYAMIICSFFDKIKTPSARKYFSLVFGTLLQLYVFKEYFYQYILLIVQAVVVYLICIKYRKGSGSIVTIESVIALSSTHIYRMITNYGGWELDITIVFMIMVCKFSLFAYRCQDGYKTGDKLLKLTQQQQKLRIANVPSFLDYICYLQFLPTAVMGPSLQYSDYLSFINRENQYQQIPNRSKVIAKTFLQALCCLFVYQVLFVIYFPIEYTTTDQFLTKSGWWMYAYATISVTFIRFKYYFAWKLNNCAVHASGISYESTITNSDGKQKSFFSKHSNSNILTIEGTWHLKDKIANWNIGVQHWLRKCVFERSKSNGDLITFMYSALWHGFYGGYYITFFLWFYLLNLSKLVFKMKRNNPNISKYFEKTGIIGQFVVWTFVNSLFSFCGTFFQILSLNSSIRILVAIKFIPALIIIIPAIIIQKSGLASNKKGKGKVEHDKDCDQNNKNSSSTTETKVTSKQNKQSTKIQ